MTNALKLCILFWSIHSPQASSITTAYLHIDTTGSSYRMQTHILCSSMNHWFDAWRENIFSHLILLALSGEDGSSWSENAFNCTRMRFAQHSMQFVYRLIPTMIRRTCAGGNQSTDINTHWWWTKLLNWIQYSIMWVGADSPIDRVKTSTPFVKSTEWEEA